MTQAPFSLAALCLPGLERFVEGELRALGLVVDVDASGPGLVRFAGTAADALRANLMLGTASRVVLDCGAFHCRSLGELVRKTSRLPWAEWLRPDESIAVQARAKRSRLFHTGAIAQRVGEGIGEALGPNANGPESDPPAAEPPAAGIEDDDDPQMPTVLVRFEHDRCQLWLDTSGEPLHRRGYRLATAKAPLRPDLARALVLAAGYTGEGPLLDPFCGSGTIAIEAACLALGSAPGAGRPFAWSRLAFGDEALERKVRADAADSTRAPRTEIAASDRDRGAVEAARSNAERAGVADAIRFDCRAMADAEWLRGTRDDVPAASGVIVTNPPFGLRVKGGDRLAHLYQALGARVRELGPDWSLTMLAHDPRLARRTGIQLTRAFRATHGGTTVHALVDARRLSGSQALESGDDDPVRE